MFGVSRGGLGEDRYQQGWFEFLQAISPMITNFIDVGIFTDAIARFHN